MAPEGFLEIDGARLEYRLWPGSTRSGAGLVLLHEGLGSLAMWRDFPQQLNAATGLSVFAWSRAGYGNSSPVALPRPLTYMHDEADRWLPPVLDATGFSDYVLIGHSDGASIAVVHAGGAADRRLRGLVLMAPHFFVEEVTVASIERAKSAYDAGGLRVRLERYHGGNVDAAFRGWSDAWLDPGFRAWSIRDHLLCIHVPTLLVQGGADEYGTLAQIKAAAASIPAPVTSIILSDCGHWPHRDKAKATIDAIAAFLAPVMA